LDKRTLKHLERLFAAEVSGKLCQLDKRTAQKLADRGLCSIETRSEPTELGMMTVTHHVLTHAGRIAYCEACSRVMPKDICKLHPKGKR
jgi:hypothetical protein